MSTSPSPTEQPAAALPETMTAVVVHGPEDYRLETVPVPQPGAGELLLRVEAVGVCASDLKCYHGAAKFWGDENRPAWAQTGRIPGHEFVGRVVAGDPAALARRGLALGDRVACEQIVPCGDCRYCERGQYWMCAPHAMFGFTEFDGAMAEYALVPARALTHPVSSALAPQHAAYAEPLSCAMHAVERADVTFGDVVVIAGAGPIGLGAIAGVRQKNPLKVIALDMSDDKLELARKCGADLTINITTEDAVARVKELTDGYGADVYIEATGHPSAVGQGLNLLRKLGTYVEYSVFGSDVTVDWSIISDDKELDVRGAHLGPGCWPAAIKLLESGVLPMDEICTHRSRSRSSRAPSTWSATPQARPSRSPSCPEAPDRRSPEFLMTTTAPAARETFLDRIGIPHPLRWGFLGVLVFMTGNGVESNFLSPHMTHALGEDKFAIVAQIIAMYSLAVLIASYLSGALADLWGPRRVMTLGMILWIVFEGAFLFSLSVESVPLLFVSYFLRGFGFPFFAFAFLVWINQIVPKKRNGTAVGWFYVMFTGGLPTLGSLFAVFAIPAFGGGAGGETYTMIASAALVLVGWAIAHFGVREPHGKRRLAPATDSAARVLTSGIVLTARNPKVLMGFLIRLINTAPEFGMFIVLPAVMADQLGWGQSRWLIMTVVIFAGNIAFNAVFGAIGDRMGWGRTVRWFGIVGSSIGLLLWWYVPHWVPAGSDWGFVVATIAGTVFGIMLAGFVPMGAIMPALAPKQKGAAMAMYTTAAGGATFLGSGVVALVFPLAGAVGVVWAFVALYACAFVMIGFLKVNQHSEDEPTAEPELESVR